MTEKHTTQTNLLYLEDAYLQQTTANIVEVILDNKVRPDGSHSASLILDQTLFYPQGGGQPADQGTVEGPNGTFEVTHVSYNGGAVLHKGTLRGNLKAGDIVTLSLDWNRRYQHMQWHTLGHIVDQAVKNTVKDAISIDGNHGIGKKLSITFATKISADQKQQIQQEVEKIIAQNVSTTTEMVTKDEMVKRGVKLPFDLPSNKPLRLLQIGKFPPMPDGGTHLRQTNEAWPVHVSDIQQDGENSLVYYTVENPESTKKSKENKVSATNDEKAPLFISLTAVRRQSTDIRAELSLDQAPVEELTTKYLGKKGKFNELAKEIRNVSPEDRKEAGQILNELKTALEQHIQKLKDSQNTTVPWTDLTAPGQPPKLGHMHPVSQAMEEVTRIFERIGFTRVRYPEVDWDHYVFEALNMPPDHPARDEWETFFIEAPIDQKFGKVVLTTHTSNGQVREMERLNSTPPIRMINIARCYRRQQDATHTQMFHQFEGLVVDKGITIQHLKGTLDYFAQEFYGPGTKSRIRPFHFQFTEPSFEVDFSCHICHGTGEVEQKDGKDEIQKTKCKFCKSGWHEVGGAGMVHPNVLKAGGIDPEEYTGFAFGWGVERTYTLKPGLNIDDIRLFYSGEMRFLEQF